MPWLRRLVVGLSPRRSGFDPKPVHLRHVHSLGQVGQATGENMAHAHCMLDTQGYNHPVCVTFTALPLKHWLHERSSLLRYTYSDCLVVWCYNLISAKYATLRSSFISWQGTQFCLSSCWLSAPPLPPASVRSFVWYLTLHKVSLALLYSLHHALPWLPPPSTSHDEPCEW